MPKINHSSINTSSVILRSHNGLGDFGMASVRSITETSANTSQVEFDIPWPALSSDTYDVVAQGVADEAGNILSPAQVIHTVTLAVPSPTHNLQPTYQAGQLITSSLTAPAGYTITKSNYRLDSPTQYGFLGGDGLTFTITIGSLSTPGTYTATLYGTYEGGATWEIAQEIQVLRTAPALILPTPTLVNVPFQAVINSHAGDPFSAVYNLYRLAQPAPIIVETAQVVGSEIDVVIDEEGTYWLTVEGTYEGETTQWRIFNEFYADDLAVPNAFVVTNRSVSGFPELSSGDTAYRSNWVDLYFTASSGQIESITSSTTQFVQTAEFNRQWQSRINAFTEPRTVDYTITFHDGESQGFQLTVAQPVQEAPGIYDLEHNFTADVGDSVSWRVGNPDPSWTMESIRIHSAIDFNLTSDGTFSSGFADINQTVRSALANMAGTMSVTVTYTHDGGQEEHFVTSGTVLAPPLPALEDPRLILPSTSTVGIPALVFWNDPNFKHARTGAETTANGQATTQANSVTSHSFYYTARAAKPVNVSVSLAYDTGETATASDSFTPALPDAPVGMRAYYSGDTFFLDWNDRLETMADAWAIEVNGLVQEVIAVAHNSGAKTWRAYAIEAPIIETVYRVAMIWDGDRTAFSEPVTYVPPEVLPISEITNGPLAVQVLVEGTEKPIAETRAAATAAANAAGSDPNARGNAYLQRMFVDTVDLWNTIADSTSDPVLQEVGRENAQYFLDHYLNPSTNCSLLGQDCDFVNVVDAAWARYLTWLKAQTIANSLSFVDWVSAGEPSG